MKRFLYTAAALVMAVTAALLPGVTGYCAITNFSAQEAALTYENTEGTILYSEGTVSDENTWKALSAWLLLPQSLQEKIASSGCRIYLSDSAQSDGSTKGQTYCSWKSRTLNGITTWIANAPYIVCRTASDDICGTTLHEIGHVFDKTITFEDLQNGSSISESTGWQAIYESEQSALAGADGTSAYNMYSAQEAFAETFRLFFEKPGLLLTVSPAAYAFMECALSEYS